jgi:hypothetical protein
LEDKPPYPRMHDVQLLGGRHFDVESAHHSAHGHSAAALRTLAENLVMAGRPSDTVYTLTLFSGDRNLHQHVLGIFVGREGVERFILRGFKSLDEAWTFGRSASPRTRHDYAIPIYKKNSQVLGGMVVSLFGVIELSFLEGRKTENAGRRIIVSDSEMIEDGVAVRRIPPDVSDVIAALQNHGVRRGTIFPSVSG